jgi:two-component system, OmpR family, copper resistance phosphate regulon response regulator CusR
VRISWSWCVSAAVELKSTADEPIGERSPLDRLPRLSAPNDDEEIVRVLIVEDDPDIRVAVRDELRVRGFAVDAVDDLPGAEFNLDVNDYDCCVLDRALPSGDAFDLLSKRRRDGDTVPTLFLTASDEVADRVAGFEAGADDYLVKPFALEELVARVTALCRRRSGATPSVVTVGDVMIDLARAEVTRAGVLVPLTAKERSILELLATNFDRVVSRSELVERCWDDSFDPMSNTVDVHMASLRRKLGQPGPIRTVPKEGYVLDSSILSGRPGRR